MKTALAVLAAVVALAAGYVGWRFWEARQLAARYAEADEIAAETIERDGNRWTIHHESVLPEPADRVWLALQQPERSHEFIEAFRKSDLKRAEGDVKVVEFQVQVLNLPLQTFTAELTFDHAAHEMNVKTLSGPQDVSATYRVQEVAPERTLLVYDADAVQKLQVPLPFSVQQGAIRELFVNQVRAIVKGIESEEAKATPAVTPAG